MKPSPRPAPAQRERKRMTDISIVMYIEMDGEDKSREISYIINEACSKIEQLKCYVFYKIKDDHGNIVHLEDV